MAKGDKSKYTAKQKRKAAHIEKSYIDRGVWAEAEERAWSTVNSQSGGGKNPGGSGRKLQSRNGSKSRHVG